jgi:dTDP-4-dehydrorhamnose 3,5-epimerase
MRAVMGKVIEVFIDLRKGSPAFGQWNMLELSEQNYTAVYIPKGFAHGLCTPEGMR